MENEMLDKVLYGNDALRPICPLLNDICSKERCVFYHADKHMCMIVAALLHG